MKNSIKLLIFFGLILAVALSGCLGGDSGAGGNTTDDGNAEDTGASHFYKNVTLSDDNMVLNFEFTTTPSTGYGWTVRQIWTVAESRVVAESRTGILNEVATGTTTPNLPGASGVQIWSFEGNQAGVVMLNFIYSGGFEDDTAVENLTYVIEVRDDKSMVIRSVSSPKENLLPLHKDTTFENNGAVLKMAFGSNPTTGYDWTVSAAPAGVLNMTKNDFNASETGLAGASGTRAFEFEGLKAGSANITFRYLRTFEAGSTVETAVYGVNVFENKTIEIVSVSYDTLYLA
ncbi:MAG: protease inhibitor I42 family protein [Methanimicrococcus sp.]|nr:protease inhibitor I42 family protein [Methanimicrococcus sp.]